MFASCFSIAAFVSLFPVTSIDKPLNCGLTSINTFFYCCVPIEELLVDISATCLWRTNLSFLRLQAKQLKEIFLKACKWLSACIGWVDKWLKTTQMIKTKMTKAKQTNCVDFFKRIGSILVHCWRCKIKTTTSNRN